MLKEMNLEGLININKVCAENENQFRYMFVMLVNKSDKQENPKATFVAILHLL